MFGISPKHALATVAVAAGLLAAAGPASAKYQHNQTEHDHVQDGTSNTIQFGFSIDVGTSENVACDGIGAAYCPRLKQAGRASRASWIEVAGESTYDQLRRWGFWRFPLFHVKDIRWDPNGPRTAAAGTRNDGRRFSFADVGKGVLDWPRIFSALKDPRDHYYFVEHDDAGNDETVDATAPRPRNPAGSANTAWTSRKYLANLEIPRRRHW